MLQAIFWLLTWVFWRRTSDLNLSSPQNWFWCDSYIDLFKRYPCRTLLITNSNAHVHCIVSVFFCSLIKWKIPFITRGMTPGSVAEPSMVCVLPKILKSICIWQCALELVINKVLQGYQKTDTMQWTESVYFSYLEIYNEKVCHVIC
jgi:hypothetical protein